MPVKLMYDTDPGIDDSMALLLGLRSPEVELLGVTAVFGNTSAEQGAQNALRVLELAGRPDVPVAVGAAQPLVRAYRGRGARVHGADGLGDAGLPPPAGRPTERTAADFIRQIVLEQPGQVTLLAVGPLTNLALAVRAEPRLAQAVKQVVIMGGAVFRGGNASPVAEANIFNDPESARIVLSAPWPLTVIGLDVTMRTVMSAAYLDALVRAGNPLTDFLGRIIPHYQHAYREFYGLEGIYTHDPSAMAYVIDPSLFRTRRVPVWVETEGRCAGQTVADVRRQWEDSREVEVCVEVDSPRLLALFWERLTGQVPPAWISSPSA